MNHLGGQHSAKTTKSNVKVEQDENIVQADGKSDDDLDDLVSGWNDLKGETENYISWIDQIYDDIDANRASALPLGRDPDDLNLDFFEVYDEVTESYLEMVKMEGADWEVKPLWQR